MMRTVVPAKLLVVLTALVSTVASLGGGLLMYYEGLALLERTVEEGSKVALSSASAVLAGSLKVPVDTAKKMKDVLSHQQTVTARDDLQYYFREIALYDILASGLYGVGYVSFSSVNQTTNPVAVGNTVWFDVTDTGEREYIYSHYDPSLFNSSSDCPGFCNVCHVVHPGNNTLGANVYNYTDTTPLEWAVGGKWAKPMKGWEDGVAFWREPTTWYAQDGTPALYLTYVVSVPTMRHIPAMAGMQTVVNTFFLVDSWDLQLNSLVASAKLVVVAAHGAVLANNIGVRNARTGCSNSYSIYENCLVYVSDLPPDIQAAVDKLNHTEAGTFHREEGYWLSKAVVFRPTPRDLLEEITLMWMYPTSAVEGEMYYALTIFIVFVALVVALDTTLAVTEVVLFAHPLRTMASAMVALEELNLTAAECTMKRVFSRVMVAEVARLAEGISFAITAMHEYKSYLPQTILSSSSDSSEPDVFRTNSAQRPPASSGTGRVRLALSLDTRHVVTAVLALPPDSQRLYLHHHSAFMQVVQRLLDAHRATLYRLMGETVYILWHNPSHSSRVLTSQAVGFCAKLHHVFSDAVGGIAAGKADVGNMGTQRTRAFNMVGKVPSRAHTLAQLNASFATKILGDAAVGSVLQCATPCEVRCRPVALVTFSDEPHAAPSPVVQVMVESAGSDTEWMYIDTSDDLYTVGWKAMLMGCIDESIEHFTAIKGHDRVVAALLSRLRAHHDKGLNSPLVHTIHNVFVDPALPP